MGETGGLNLSLVVAQVVSFIFWVLLLGLPFLFWRRFKRRDARMNERLERLEETIGTPSEDR